MKKYLWILLLLTSCMNVSYKDGNSKQLPIVEKKFIPSHTEITYHYGYSIMKGKYCMHWGPEEINEKYFLYYMLDNDSIKYSTYKARFDSLSIGDSLTIQYQYRYIDDILSDTLLKIK